MWKKHNDERDSSKFSKMFSTLKLGKSNKLSSNARHSNEPKNISNKFKLLEAIKIYINGKTKRLIIINHHIVDDDDDEHTALEDPALYNLAHMHTTNYWSHCFLVESGLDDDERSMHFLLMIQRFQFSFSFFFFWFLISLCVWANIIRHLFKQIIAKQQIHISHSINCIIPQSSLCALGYAVL